MHGYKTRLCLVSKTQTKSEDSVLPPELAYIPLPSPSMKNTCNLQKNTDTQSGLTSFDNALTRS